MKTEKQKLKTSLDKKWADKVKEKGRCEYCGRKDYLNAHHFYSRSNFSVRWDLDNGFCLCSGCHCLCNHSAHKSPADFVEWAIQTRGKKWYDELRKKKNKTFKLDIISLKQINL